MKQDMDSVLSVLEREFPHEHHMFPNVAFHALPTLGKATKAEFPPMYPWFTGVYRKIWSAYQHQKKEPNALSRPVEVDLSVYEGREVDGRIEIRPGTER
jgi:hypothetical protein